MISYAFASFHALSDYQTIFAPVPRIRLSYGLKYTPLRRGIQTMCNDNTDQKKRIPNMTVAQSNERLGFRVEDFRGIPVTRMLAESKYKPGDEIWKTKEKVYGDILQYLDAEGYPIDGYTDFSGANVSDLILYIIGPILSSFRRKTGRNVRLRREKVITSVEEELAVVDLVAVAEEECVLIVEGTRSLGQSERQCLLAMKDMGDNNGGGEVYGFTTAGGSWRMFKYDGVSFRKTESMDILFETMDEHKEKWMKDHSILVDCIYVALSRGGGIAKKDVVISG